MGEFEKRKVYVDTCIISRIVDSRIKPIEAKALSGLSFRKDITFVTSKQLKIEVAKTKDETKRYLLQFLSSLIEEEQWKADRKKIPPVFNTRIMGQGVMGALYVKNDPLINILHKVFDKEDSIHIYQAIKSDIQLFLTIDESTILSRSNDFAEHPILEKYNLKFFKPSELLDYLG